MLLYALLVGVFPTIVVWADFGNLEATEEDWDQVIVFSVLASIPLVMGAWMGLRNIRHVPFFAVVLLLLTVFHLWTTSLACFQGLLGEPYSDPALTRAAFFAYTRFFFLFTLPFVVAYLVWYFWRKRRPLQS